MFRTVVIDIESSAFVVRIEDAHLNHLLHLLSIGTLVHALRHRRPALNYSLYAALSCPAQKGVDKPRLLEFGDGAGIAGNRIGAGLVDEALLDAVLQ